jgi:hypothetical protein
MLPDTGIDDVKKQRNAEYAKYINDPVLSSLKMEGIRLLFYFGTILYMFRTVTPSIFRSLRLYIQRHIVQVLWLPTSKQPQNLYMTYLILYVQSYTPDDGRKDRP